MQEPEIVGGTPAASGARRVLVADADPAIRLMCSTWLTLDGYDVIEAANGQEALELARTEAPDLVLLDLSMPVLDGFVVAAALRADERTRELPLVVLSGEAGPHVAEHVYEMGAAGYFTKPFDPGTVARFVRRVIAEVTGGNGSVSAGNAV